MERQVSPHGAVAPLPRELTAALGVPEGLATVPACDPSDPRPLPVIDPDGTGRSFLVLEAADAASGRGGGGLRFLRILPLDLGAGSGGASLVRWQAEWDDMRRATQDGRRAQRHMFPAPAAAPVLPPIFYCRAKHVWIRAICPACRPGTSEAGPPPRRCPTCGSPGESGPGSASALVAIAERAQGGQNPDRDADGPAIACAACDRREVCFAASPGGPVLPDVLTPLSDRPWGGAVVEAIHLPLRAWWALCAGVAWPDLRESLRTLPRRLIDEAEARLGEDRPFLFPADTQREGFALESFLLRLEVLRQVLSLLSDAVLLDGHPHLGIVPESVWVRLEGSDTLRSAMWGASVRFLDPAPACRPGPDGCAAHLAAASRPACLVPPGCSGDDRAEGLCISSPTSGSVRGDSIAVDFIPSVPFARPLSKGEPVTLEVPGSSGRPSRDFPGHVEVGFRDVCRIRVHTGGVSSEETRNALTGGGAAVRLRVSVDHVLTDDLFAVGTLWISSLLARPGSLDEAARFRDALVPRLTGVGAAGGGETECRRAVLESPLFAVHGGRHPVESGTAGPPLLDAGLLGRAVALGMRLCGALPGGYPGQGHQPATESERRGAFIGLLETTTSLGREVRESWLAAIRSGMGDPVLDALGSYLAQRLGSGAGAADGGERKPR